MTANETPKARKVRARALARAAASRKALFVAEGLSAVALVSVLVLGLAFVTYAVSQNDETASAATSDDSHGSTASGDAEAISAEAWDEKIAHEEFEWVDPELPAVPDGKVKKFEIDVYEHVTKVSDDLAPTRVWSYAINGQEYRGNGTSAPMVVNEGDEVEITLLNGSNEKMDVQFPHSIDFHSSEVDPAQNFATIAPGEKKVMRFSADHPGVFMYHCATPPVLHHTAAGMVGMMIVKDKDLAAADRELWINQQEYYIGKPGEDADYAKAQAATPDVIAFNGYGSQYVTKPIKVDKDEKVRMYVLNSGPSIWSAFHVIGTVFDKAVTDNGVARHAQTVNLAPSQGGYVEFTLEEEGTYPFVTHAFADMEKGAVGSLQTKQAKGSMGH
jgi:nitrite reductase (NO-forming)